MGAIGIGHMEVHVDLLGGTIGPFRRHVPGCMLDTDDPPSLAVDDAMEPRILVDHAASEHVSPERALGLDVGGIEHHDVSDEIHVTSVDATAGAGTSGSCTVRVTVDEGDSTMATNTGETKHRIYTTSFASVYPHYVTKAENKGRTKDEVDEIIQWLTGYTQAGLDAQLDAGTDFETFFSEAPTMNPDRSLITGVVCGVRVEEVEEPTMREIRYLDKLVDELARGKAMEKILRSA